VRAHFFVILLALLTASPIRAVQADDDSERIAVALKIEATLAETLNASDPRLLEMLSDQMGPSYLQDLTVSALDEGLKQKIQDAGRKTAIRRLSDQLKWSVLWGKAKSIGAGVRTLSRMQGRGIAVWAAAGVAAKILHPIVCTALGHPELIVPTISFVPGPAAAATTGMAVQKLFEKKKLYAMYGGQESSSRFSGSW
jgi:hypothetical protein